MSNVVCGSCRACCHKQTVTLIAEDQPNLPYYKTVVVPVGKVGVHQLAAQPNGDCVHLGKTGCTIYEKRPQACRSFDCRKHLKLWTGEERKQIQPDILKAATERTPTLDRNDLNNIEGYALEATKAFMAVYVLALSQGIDIFDLISDPD